MPSKLPIFPRSKSWNGNLQQEQTSLNPGPTFEMIIVIVSNPKLWPLLVPLCKLQWQFVLCRKKVQSPHEAVWPSTWCRDAAAGHDFSFPFSYLLSLHLSLSSLHRFEAPNAFAHRFAGCLGLIEVQFRLYKQNIMINTSAIKIACPNPCITMKFSNQIEQVESPCLKCTAPREGEGWRCAPRFCTNRLQTLATAPIQVSASEIQILNTLSDSFSWHKSVQISRQFIPDLRKNLDWTQWCRKCTHRTTHFCT